MSEQPSECDRFEALLMGGASATEVVAWHGHLENCTHCREQWAAHQMLMATFSSVPVPELSSSFGPGLQRKIEAIIEVKPLSGWRTAAMLAYAIIAITLLGWVFQRFPLPRYSVDPSSPWILAVVIGAVPLTLWLTIRVTRWLPPAHRKRFTQLGLL